MNDRFQHLLKEAQTLSAEERRLLVVALEAWSDQETGAVDGVSDAQLVDRMMERKAELQSGSRAAISRKELMRRVKDNLES